jgi:Transposase, Mutator family
MNRPVPDQDPVSLFDPLGAVPRPDGHRLDLPGYLADRARIPGHVSALLQSEDGGGGGRTLRGVTGPAAGVGRRHEGDDQRGPQFRDCARMVHKTANVLDKLPKGSQAKAKQMLHEIYLAESRAEAEKAFDLFLATYQAKHPKATNCLEKDQEVLLTFYAFPAEQWLHIRTTNPIESTFSTVRLRHAKTKGSGTRTACLTMVYKLMESASKKWRALNGSLRLQEVIAGAVFVDGVKKPDAA